MIKRSIYQRVKPRIFKGKAIIVIGPRQSGKTTFINQLLLDYPGQYYRFNGDEPDVREQFKNATSTRLKSLIRDKKIVFIDEAQRIEEIGLAIKLLVDNYPDIQVIATGSSAFDLAGKIKEPLTGRKYEYRLFPLSYQEMVNDHGLLEEKRYLQHRLIFGYYPEIVTKQAEEIELLTLLADSYLFKDLFNLEKIKKPLLLEKIIRVLAFQVGNEVSYNEIAQLVGADNQTVEKYISLMEKAYIIHRLPALSRNKRNEIKKGQKIFFWDNGILNTIKGNLNDLSSRSDVGALWENFVISERRKYLSNNFINDRSYFWRNTEKMEIDYIEERNNLYSAFEIKWNPLKKVRFSKSFTGNHDVYETKVINPDTFPDWISM
ncbi:MAG: ATP-binding protein [Candidatus Cloacimonetes bacterium]|nr:ATP-binding protein [Candidatus Cloacimonadota bacterium]